MPLKLRYLGFVGVFLFLHGIAYLAIDTDKLVYG
jgi:hypothetical protein